MATAGELIDDVVDIVQDTAYDEDFILDLMNKGLEVIAQEVFLPDLQGTGQVTTIVGAEAVPLPADYHRGLHFVSSSLNPRAPIKVYPAIGRLLAQYPGPPGTHLGTVRGVAVLAKSLTYLPAPPEADTLTLHYYRKPLPLILDMDVPTCLPDRFHDMLTDYACWKIWDRIEDGIEGKKVNADTYHGYFVEKLASELPIHFEREGLVSRRRAPVVRGAFC